MLLLRIILLPFTLLYALAILWRNFLYKTGILTRFGFDLPVICIGNLAAGGTGKTPHTEWLISKLIQHKKIALLSRGYKRKTTGYVFADIHSTPETIGDEPFQVKRKFPGIAVGVAENRVLGIPDLLGDAPGTEILIMDDGFQHLPVKAGLYILLTDFNRLYTSDWLLPSGLLREFKSGSQRADLIIVTKCPLALEQDKKQKIVEAIRPLPNRRVLFSSLKYGALKPVFDAPLQDANKQASVLAFSGIANANLFEQHLADQFTLSEAVKFRDHHNYSAEDLQKIIARFKAIDATQKILVCTEKDAVKLQQSGNKSLLSELPLYYLPVEIFFHADGETIVLDAVNELAGNFE